MAKTGKIKKKQTTVHSRAARRAVSPSIDLDKSIKSATLPDTPKSAFKPHVLGVQDGGIAKKSQKTKSMKRQQRLRHLKGLERGADVLDKMALKVQKSVVKEKTVKERSKGWEEINGETKQKEKKKNKFELLAEQDAGKKDTERAWVSDEEMPGVDEDQLEPEISGEVKELVVPASIPLPVAAVEEDEML